MKGSGGVGYQTGSYMDADVGTLFLISFIIDRYGYEDTFFFYGLYSVLELGFIPLLDLLSRFRFLEDGLLFCLNGVR